MKEQGLSLLELLTTLSIISVLTLSAIPAISNWQYQLDLRTSTQAVMRSLALTRQEAVISGIAVKMVSNGTWENGWKVFVDLNNDNLHNDGEALIFTQASMQNIRIRGNQPVASQITYRQDGFSVLSNNALQLGTLTLCSELTLNVAYAIKIARGGRARIEQLPGTHCLESSD